MVRWLGTLAKVQFVAVGGKTTLTTLTRVINDSVLATPLLDDKATQDSEPREAPDLRECELRPTKACAFILNSCLRKEVIMRPWTNGAGEMLGVMRAPTIDVG